MLEQWDPLTLYFNSIVAEKRDPSYVTDSILQNLKNLFIKAQMEFLQVQLHRTNEFNTLFQSDQPLLHALHEKVCRLFKELMSGLVKLDVIRNCDVLTLNVRCKLEQVSTVDVYVGINATKTLKIVCVDKDAVLKFKTTCVNFLEELIDQIRSRFGSPCLNS